MRRYIEEDFTSGKCYVNEYTGGSSPEMKRREITPEQFAKARAVSRRQSMTAEERAALIESILDDLAALGAFRGTEKAGA